MPPLLGAVALINILLVIALYSFFSYKLDVPWPWYALFGAFGLLLSYAVVKAFNL